MKKTILIVDDDAMMRVNLFSFFKDKGYEVFDADNGKTGLEIIKKENPEAILLDIVMPEMTGLEVLKEIEAMNPAILSRVTMMTNASDMNFMTEAIEKGVPRYILKSDMSLEQIFTSVDSSLSK